MRILGFVMGMSGFIIGGMAHLPLVGVLSLVVAVTALFLAAPRQSSSRVADVVLVEEMPVGQLDANVMYPVSSRRPARGRHHPARHGVAHATWRALPTRAPHRAVQKEK